MQMRNMETLVLKAMRDKAPELHRQLTESGQLRAFVTEQAEEINSQIATLMVELASKQGANEAKTLPEKAAILNTADKMATEIVLHEMLQFPQDETSLPSRDVTTSSAMAT